jgi:hypothetical protein
MPAKRPEYIVRETPQSCDTEDSNRELGFLFYLMDLGLPRPPFFNRHLRTLSSKGN